MPGLYRQAGAALSGPGLPVDFQGHVAARTGAPEDAKKSIDQVLSTAAANPVALAELALVTLGDRDVPKAIETLQLAVAASPSPMPSIIADAVAGIAETLTALGEVRAGLGHLLLAANLLPGDERVLATIVRSNASAQVPLLFKEEPDFSNAPSGAAWQAQYDEAIAPTHRGAWRVAADKLTTLSQSQPDVPLVCARWLRSVPGCWMIGVPSRPCARLAALEVPLDDRVEAEALAQLLDEDAQTDSIDVVQLEYPIHNIDELTEKLSDRRVAAAHVETSAWTERSETPPRHSYMLLDRPCPPAAPACARRRAKRSGARAGLRPANRSRGSAGIDRGSSESCRRESRAAGFVRRSIGPPRTRGKARRDSRQSMGAKLELAPTRRYSRRPGAQAAGRAAPTRHPANLDHDPLGVLAGKTPQQAGPDPRLRIPLLAAILLLELSFQEPSVGDLFDELRRRLELPPARPIDPANWGDGRIPLVRLHRVQWQTADDEVLLSANRRATFAAARLALRQTLLAILDRKSLESKVDRGQIFGLLSRLDDDTSQAIRYLDQARSAAEAAGKSTAMWDVQELSLRLERGEPEEFGRLVGHIQQHHGREPGVAQG